MALLEIFNWNRISTVEPNKDVTVEWKTNPLLWMLYWFCSILFLLPSWGKPFERLVLCGTLQQVLSASQISVCTSMIELRHSKRFRLKYFVVFPLKDPSVFSCVSKQSRFHNSRYAPDHLHPEPASPPLFRAWDCLLLDQPSVQSLQRKSWSTSKEKEKTHLKSCQSLFSYTA